jgi:hypothetical protein
MPKCVIGLSPNTLKTWSIMICFATLWFSFDLTNGMKPSEPQAGGGNQRILRRRLCNGAKKRAQATEKDGTR